ncbi:hypothetical protein [Treponema endosymbiont of Eucomonympha sp.]|uniref:hypothetical protein n=1 Tax=Treponema endosymbiont of Eucomonympha sp. TaxID=1580831 RepID=UPI0016502031|nr:hypothetical protein [Treponema endosymbiont of Eucomonympha sp.]
MCLYVCRESLPELFTYEAIKKRGSAALLSSPPFMSDVYSPIFQSALLIRETAPLRLTRRAFGKRTGRVLEKRRAAGYNQA